ncbi:MAG: glycosyltransferase [Candidatus Thorarchaeota archaeon]
MTSNYPPVSILIPTFNPNILALVANFTNIKKISYPNYEIVISDNSNDQIIINDLKDLCKKYHVKFFHRETKTGFKSGNINYVIKNIEGKYIFFMDIDQILIPDRLEPIIQLMEKDEKIAFVQAKYKICNANSLIRIAIAIMYSYYYEILAIGKDLRQTVLFNGTTACFRTKVIKELRGFPEETYCEDIDISTKILLSGYKSRFIDIYASYALVQWKLKEIISSIWRWAHGATTISKIRFKNIFMSKKISFSTKIELFMNNLIWIAGVGLVLANFCIILLYLGNMAVIRPIYTIQTNFIVLSIDGYQIFALFFVINTLIGSFLAIMNSRSFSWLLYLPAYFIASISLFYFLLPAVIDGLFNWRSPQSKKSSWNRKINFSFYALFMIPFFLINAYCTIDALVKINFLCFYFFFMSISLIAPFIYVLFEKNDVFFKKTENIYFENMIYNNLKNR